MYAKCLTLLFTQTKLYITGRVRDVPTSTNEVYMNIHNSTEDMLNKLFSKVYFCLATLAGFPVRVISSSQSYIY